MTEPLSEFEQRLVSGLREHFAGVGLEAAPASVVAEVTGRRVGLLGAGVGLRLLAAAGMLAALVFVAAGALVLPRVLDQLAGIQPATARVGDTEYLVGTGRGLIVSAGELIEHGQVTQASDVLLVGRMAYQLPFVEPSNALVMDSSGLFDDQPAAGEYALLWADSKQMRSPPEALCAYFEEEYRPAECSPPELTRLFPAEPLLPPYDGNGVGQALAGRGFGLFQPTPAETVRPGIITLDELIAFVESSFERPDERIVSIHAAAVSSAFGEIRPPLDDRPAGRDLERELMYVVETTGHASGNCFLLVAARRSGGPTFEACHFADRSAPSARKATPSPDAAPPSPPAVPSPPGPVDGSAITTRPLIDRSYDLGDVTFELRGIAIAGLAQPGFMSWRVLDGQTIAMNYRASNALPVPPSDPGPSSVWLADLDELTMRLIHPNGPIFDVDATGERLLLWWPGALTIIDRVGEELDRLAVAFPGGVFLADGRVIVLTGGRVELWQPGVGIVSESTIPLRPGRTAASAIGDRVALFSLFGPSPSEGVLLDPASWETIGSIWPSTEAALAAVSPDGRRFVVAVERDGGGEALEIRDASSGQVLAARDVHSATPMSALAWPTDNVILAVRPDESDIARPELYLASDFDEPPLLIEPLSADQIPWQLSSRGNHLLAADWDGDLVLIEVSERSAGRDLTMADAEACPVTQPTVAPPEIGEGLFGWWSAHGNEALWVGPLGQEGVIAYRPVAWDSRIGYKFGWWRHVPGQVEISGRRLDAPAPPLRGKGSEGYGDTGFQASGVTFPTEGCWEITGTVGESSLTFVVFVFRVDESEP